MPWSGSSDNGSTAARIAISLYQDYGIDVPYVFNRKEKKNHGEGGRLVGASIEDRRVLIVDDVITAGTAIRQAIELIKLAKGRLSGVCIGLDRQEKGQTELSAVQDIEKSYKIPIQAVVTLEKIVLFCSF